MADDAALSSKRKASDAGTDASSVIKRLRLSTASEPDETPTETGGAATSSTFNDSVVRDNYGHASSSGLSFPISLSERQRTIASHVHPFQGPSQKGKEKASNLYSESSPEAPPNTNTVLSYPSLHSLNNKKRLSGFRSLHKGKTSLSSFNGSWNLPKAGSSSGKQRRRESFVNVTEQDVISISSDSEDEPTGTSTTNKRLSGNDTSQVDVIDLTLDLDEDDIIIIDPSPEPLPLPLKGLHSREFIQKVFETDVSYDNEASNSVNIPTSDPQSIPPSIHSILSNFSEEQQSSSGLFQTLETEVTAFQSAIQPDAEIVDHTGFGHDSPAESLVEEILGLDVSKETNLNLSDGSNERHALEPPQSPITKTLSPSPPPPIHPKNEDAIVNLVDPIAELQIDAGRNTSEDETSQLITPPEDGLLVKHEEEHLRGNFHAPRLSSDESSSNTPKTPDNELLPKRPTLVKEPDFSKISAGDTEPVPDYSDRLVAAIKWPAEKLSTELHDMINRLPPHYLFNPQMKYIFEAVIEDNTADDEPLAPKIPIIGRQNGPVTPPWEFYYTNRIVYGEGVPRSDKKLLQGCDCIGPCDPKSKTCACVQRQMAWTGGAVKGFLYKKEKLFHPHYPVFECNDACECSEECMNRVVQNGRKHRISIVLTKNKGWGVFAEEKIPRGTYLGIYSGEIILEAEADERGKLYDRYGRTYLFDIDFYHLRSLDKDVNKGKDEGKDEERSNTYTIDAFHVGNFTRFLNHSCDPNCQITATYVNEPDVRKPALTIFTSRDIQKGEEVTFAYFGEGDDDEEMSDAELEDKTVKVGAGPSPHKQQAIHRKCLCGAANCRGQMF